jgi:hypothetical protein
VGALPSWVFGGFHLWRLVWCVPLCLRLSRHYPVLSTASTCLASTRGICGDDGHFTVVNLQLFRRTFFAGRK